MDPQWTSDGKPYAPHRYKEIVKEIYHITNNLNTSYTDVYEITPLERRYLLMFIKEDIDNHNEKLRKAMEERNN